MVKNNITTRIAMVILALSLLAPSFVFAAWWNPISWFNPVTEIQQEAEKTVIKERIVEKPVAVDLSGIYERLGVIEKRLLALENRSPSVIVRETVSASADLTDEVSDLKNSIESLASRFDDHQSCMRRWSIGNEFMLADDVYHCSNK